MITKPTNWDNLINQQGRFFDTCIVVGTEGQNAQVISGDKIAAVPSGTESLCGNNLDCGKVTIQEKKFVLKNVAQGSWEKHNIQKRWNKYAVKIVNVEENLGEHTQQYSRYSTTYGVKTVSGQPTIVDGKYSGWASDRSALPTSASGLTGVYLVADANGIRTGTYANIMNTDLTYYAGNLRNFTQSGLNRSFKYDLMKLTTTTECDYDNPQGTVLGDTGAYPDNGIQDGYWYVLDTTYQGKGSLIGTVYSTDLDSYPTNGIQDGFWYVFLGVQSVIRRGDRLAVWKRVVLGNQKSGWLPCGVYYANKPKTITAKDAYGRVHSTTTFSAYDSMVDLNYEPYGATITDWNNKSSRQVVQEICTQIGLALEDANQVPTTIVPAPPYGYSARQIFEDVATSVCGNWMLTYVDTSPSGQTYLAQVPKLRLKKLASPDESNYCNVGVHARANYELGEFVPPITHVILNYGTNDNGATLTKEAVATLDNGRTLEKTLSIYTDGDIVQTIANTILSEQSDVVYQPLTCTKAVFDLCFELGDTAKLDGHYFIITKKEDGSDRAYYTNLQAVDILAEEETYTPSRQAQDLKRDNATTKAQIKVTANAIRQSVTGTKVSQYDSTHTYEQYDFVYEGNTYYKSLQNNNTGHALTDTSWWQVTSAAEIIEAGIDVNLDNLKLTYKGTSGVNQQLVLSNNGVEIAGSAVTVIADATNITGQLVADQIAANAITLTKLSTSLQNTISGAYDMAEEASDKVAAWAYEGGTYIDGEMLMTGTVTATKIQGGTVNLLTSVASVAGTMTITSATSGNYAVDISSNAALRLRGLAGTVHISAGADSGDAILELFRETSSVDPYIRLSPRIALGNASYGTANPSGSAPEGTLYFKYS